MARLRDNIIASYAGQMWSVLMAVAFVPIYIRVLGVESFGLVGFMLSMQALSQFFDFGIGGAVSRALAQRAHDSEANRTTPDLVRTFELLIWPLSLLFGAMIWLAGPIIATSWLHPQHLTQSQTAAAVSLIGLTVAALSPSSFYSNCLSGLEQQTRLNLITAAFATVRGPGVLLALYWGSPTIGAFLWWYVAAGVSQSVMLAAAVWCSLPSRTDAPTFRVAELLRAKSFAGGLFAITALSLGLSQLDRLTLSAMRSLEELGYYGLAISVAAGMARMVHPMFNALLPRFSRLTATNQIEALSHLYHLSSQYVAVVIAAIALVLIVFAQDILYLWTGDNVLAARVALPMAILVTGAALNGFMNLPYALQLANGWTWLTLRLNLISLLLGIPFCMWAVAEHGMNGAACLWLLVNLGSIAVGIPLMHRRLLRGEMSKWYIHDLMPPVLASAAVTLFARLELPALSRDARGLVWLGAVSAASLAAAALVSPAFHALARKGLPNRNTP